MFYTVVDDAGAIYFYSTNPDNPDLQHHIDKWEHLGTHIVEYPQLWNVRVGEDGTLWSTHQYKNDAEEKIKWLDDIAWVEPLTLLPE